MIPIKVGPTGRDPGQLNDRAIEVRDYPVQP